MSYSPLKKRQRLPYVVAFKSVMREPKLSLEAKAVLIILKSYGNSDGTHCFPAISTLAKVSGCSKRTIIRHLNELKSAGLIFSDQRSARGSKLSTNTYLIYDETQARAAYKPRAGNGTRKVSGMAHGERQNIVPFTERNERLA